MSSKLAKSALFVTISEIIFNLSGFLIHSLVGRILGPEDYGKYGLVVTLTTMVIILIGNGIPTAMAKYISEIFETNPCLVRIIKGHAIKLQSLIIGAITVLFFLASPFIAKILGDPSLTKLFRISTLIIPAFAAASFYFSYYTGLHKFNLQSGLKISRSFFRIIFIISLAYFFRVEGSIVGYILAPGSVFLAAYLIDRFRISKELREAEARCDASANPDFDWRKLTNYAWQIVLFFLAYELLISIDLYLVQGILKDEYLTGIWNASLTIARIPYYIFYALTVILLPVVSKESAQKNHQKVAEIINHSLRLMIVLLVPSIILMSVFSRPLIRLFYSHRYIDAAAPMAILVWGVGFLTIFYVLCFVMSGAGKVKKPMIISLIGLFFSLILNYILIQRYALIGSAIATSIASFIVMLAMLRHIRLDFGVSLSIKSLSKITLAGTLMYAASFLFNRGELIFLLWSTILLAFYLVILYLLKEITPEDLKFLKKMVWKKKK